MHFLDVPRFSTAEAAAAAGIPTGTLNAQMQRGDIALAPDDVPEVRNPGTGRSRLFSARRILHIALTQRLAALGIALGTASRLALAFTDHGSADDDACGLLDEALPEPRMLGQPFPDDITVMQLTFGGDAPAVAILRARDVRLTFGGGDTVAFIDLDALYRRTLARLQVTP